jgi:hypothetical protein
MSVENIVSNILEKNLDSMRENINAVLAEKAVEKLEEMKAEVASKLFNQE